MLWYSVSVGHMLTDSVFRVRSSDSIGEEVYTEMLLKNTTPYITTQVVVLSQTYKYSMVVVIVVVVVCLFCFKKRINTDFLFYGLVFLFLFCFVFMKLKVHHHKTF